MRQRLPTLLFSAAGAVAACGFGSVLRPPDPALVGPDWVLHEVPGAPILISTPPAFASRGAPGCYQGHLQDSLPYGPGWRAFCVGLHPPAEPIPLFTPGLESDCVDGCRLLHTVETTQMTLGGRDVIVQTALVSGGTAGKERAPEMLVQIPVQPGLAILVAEYGDAADAAVILGVAQTISVRAPAERRTP